MKKNSLFFLFAILVIASLMLSACGGAQPAEAPGEKKIVTLIWTQEPDYLNPMYTNMWFSSITQQIWNCQAWDWDEETNPRPVLVKEMPSLDNGGISADGKTLTITLRDEIKWSDGTPITSADFLFTAAMFTAPSNTVHTTMPYDLFVDIQAPDERVCCRSSDTGTALTDARREGTSGIISAETPSPARIASIPPRWSGWMSKSASDGRSAPKSRETPALIPCSTTMTAPVRKVPIPRAVTTMTVWLPGRAIPESPCRTAKGAPEGTSFATARPRPFPIPPRIARAARRPTVTASAG